MRRGQNAMLSGGGAYPYQTHSLAFPSHNPPTPLDALLIGAGGGFLGGSGFGPIGAGIGTLGGGIGGVIGHASLYGPGSESYKASQGYNNEYGPGNQPPAYLGPEGPVFHPSPSRWRGNYE